MKSYVKCILTSSDGLVSYEGNAPTESAAAESALKVARRKNKKAALDDFVATYHVIGTVVEKKHG